MRQIELKVKGEPSIKKTVWEMEVGDYFFMGFKHENVLRNYASLLESETGRVVKVNRTDTGVKVTRTL